MFQLGDFWCIGLDAEFGKKCIIVQLIIRNSRLHRRVIQQTLPVERQAQLAAFRLLTHPIKPNCVEPFEDIAVVTVAGQMALLIDEALHLLEAGDDAFLARRAGA